MTGDATNNVAICVRDLKPGDNVLQFFAVRSKEPRKTRAGQDYLDLVLGDATGAISGKMWPESVRKWGQEFNPGDIVKVEARVEAYRDRPQVVVDKIRLADPSEIPDLSALIRMSPFDSESLFEEVKGTAESLAPPELAKLVVEILDRHSDAIKTFPAARMIHHAYRGGLIEHIATVTRKVEAILNLEKNINRGIALAGAILHDIGKIHELAPAGGGRTSEGRLIGHLILGVNLVRGIAVEQGVVDRAWLREVEHILLSHHGETQFGSPVKPLTREAILVHFIDNLDAKLKIINEALESVELDGFTAYNKWLEGRAFAGSQSLPEEDDDVRD
ncbi:MAG: 3'-5' exoribonuclease YhaM family protein [Desulfomonilaceae bacterium]